MRGILGGRALFGLVNNAGVGFHGPLLYQPIAEFQRNVEINLIGTLTVTQARTYRLPGAVHYTIVQGREGHSDTQL